jgi:hypothetical protein
MVSVGSEMHDDPCVRRHRACNLDVKVNLAVRTAGVSRGAVGGTVHRDRRYAGRG